MVAGFIFTTVCLQARGFQKQKQRNPWYFQVELRFPANGLT